MHVHDKTSTTAHSKDRQQHSRTIKTGTSAFKRAGREYSASLATDAQNSTPFRIWCPGGGTARRAGGRSRALKMHHAILWRVRDQTQSSRRRRGAAARGREPDAGRGRGVDTLGDRRCPAGRRIIHRDGWCRGEARGERERAWLPRVPVVLGGSADPTQRRRRIPRTPRAFTSADASRVAAHTGRRASGRRGSGRAARPPPAAGRGAGHETRAPRGPTRTTRPARQRAARARLCCCRTCGAAAAAATKCALPPGLAASVARTTRE